MYTDFSIGSVYVRMDMPFVQCLGVSLCVHIPSVQTMLLNWMKQQQWCSIYLVCDSLVPRDKLFYSTQFVSFKFLVR